VGVEVEVVVVVVVEGTLLLLLVVGCAMMEVEVVVEEEEEAVLVLVLAESWMVVAMMGMGEAAGVAAAERAVVELSWVLWRCLSWGITRQQDGIKVKVKDFPHGHHNTGPFHSETHVTWQAKVDRQTTP